MATVTLETGSHDSEVRHGIRFFKRHIALFIIALGIAIRVPLVFTPLTYGLSDTWRYADTASIAHNFLENGFNLFYPQVNWGGSGPGYVETEFQLYPFVTALLYLVFGEQVWLGRLLSLLLTIPTLILFYALARRIVPTRAALWGLFFFTISPLSIRYSIGYMPEATVLFFYVSALYLFQRWLDEQSLPILMLAAISTALAILVKPTSVHIGLIFLLLLIERYRLGFLKQWPIWLFALISLLPGTLWYLHARNLYLTYGNTFGVISGGDSKFGNLNYWLNPGFYRQLAGLDFRWIFARAGIVPFLIGLVLSVRKRQPLLLLFGVITIPIYYMIVARYAQEEWGVQYHVYLIPFAALGVGLGLAWLFEKVTNRKSLIEFARSPYVLVAVFTVVLTLIQAGRIYYNELLVPFSQSLWECANDVAEFVPQGTYIIVSTTSTANDNGTPNNYQEPNIFFYAHRYGWSLPADRHTPEQVEAFRQSGAGYLVIYDDELYYANPALVSYMDANAQQIGPGLSEHCAIFQFNDFR